jgi:hypothetical protein
VANGILETKTGQSLLPAKSLKGRCLVMAKKVLVIDDDPVTVQYISKLLTNNGYQTVTAPNGVEGLEVLKKEKPDLVTLDLQMPEEWGPRFNSAMNRMLNRPAFEKHLEDALLKKTSAEWLKIQGHAGHRHHRPFGPARRAQGHGLPLQAL